MEATTQAETQDVPVSGHGPFQGCDNRSAQKLRAAQRFATGAARRLVEHRPVDYVPADARDREAFDALGPLSRRAPRTQDELVQYVTWAAPRARKLGTRVSPAELRAIGFVHALFAENQERQRREAEEMARAIGFVHALFAENQERQRREAEEMARAARELAKASAVVLLAFVVAVSTAAFAV
jgi:electron transfer flavoprotein alpha subunit